MRHTRITNKARPFCEHYLLRKRKSVRILGIWFPVSTTHTFRYKLPTPCKKQTIIEITPGEYATLDFAPLTNGEHLHCDRCEDRGKCTSMCEACFTLTKALKTSDFNMVRCTKEGAPLHA